MRKLTIIGGTAAAAAALALPSIASAHTVAVTCTGNHATATGSAFPAQPLVTQATLTVDGVAQAPVNGLAIPGPNPVFTFPTPIFGQHTLIANFVNGGPWTSPATAVNCGEAPPVVPPVVVPPVVVPPATPPPVVAIDQPISIRRVVKPKPKVASKRRPRVITCAYLRAHHAGPRSFAALGFYYNCRAPIQRVPDHVPVTG